MRKLTGIFVLIFCFITGFLPPRSAAQKKSNVDVFTVSVAPPVSRKDVQMRYVFGGNVNNAGSIAAGTGDGNQIVIETGLRDGHPAQSFKLIAYSSGCQFVTISVDDLAASKRQGDFACVPLATVSLRGRVDTAKLGGKDLQVEALYVCRWAGRFFAAPGMAVSPFSLTRAHVETDGSFALELPDFANDPLWDEFSHDATLMFFLADASTGERLVRLSAPRDLALAGSLKVAPGYPAEIQFTLRSQSVAKPAKASGQKPSN